MSNISTLINLIKTNLLKNKPYLNGIYNYTKKVPELQELRPESDLLLLNKLDNAINYKDFGNYERLIHDPYKDIIHNIKRNLNELSPSQENKNIFDEYLNNYSNGQKLLQKENTLQKPINQNRDNINDLEYFSNYYEEKGDELLKATNNPDDLSLLSQNINKREDSLINDIIKNQEELENSKISIPHYISDKDEISNALENLLIKKQQDRLYNQYILNQVTNEQTEFPVKQITGKELDYYRDFKDDPELYTKTRTKILKDDSDRLQERFNKWFPNGVGNELNIFRNSIKNKNFDIDKDLDDYLEILNTGRFLKNFK